MNKNTRASNQRARDAYGRIKHGRSQPQDSALAANIGLSPRKSKHPKVARGLSS